MATYIQYMYNNHIRTASKITPIRAIFFMKISVALMCAWPPPLKTKQFIVILFKASKSVCLSCAVLQVTIKMMVFRFRYTDFQVLYYEMEMFCKQADDKTYETLQRYVDNNKYVYGIYCLWSYLTTTFVICGPLIFPQQEFPTDAKYPFSVEEHPVKSMIYLHQSVVGLQAAAGMCMDCNIAMFLFYSAARLEILAQKMCNVMDEHELNKCIKLHNEILRYTRKVTTLIRPLIFATISMTTIGVVFGSLNMVTDQPIMVKVQYAIVIVTASVELLICALPADNLMHMSTNICFAAYESLWFQGNVSMQKKILQIIFRSQKSEVISINGILPALSLRYYAGFLYTSCSYFTAIRIMVNENLIE
ncbi:uncharacterized protein LOC105283053 isoform X2 [Ooceraea biroi]|uniref:uncharacterized protein LOC105283053 isoform X2 n=1 Tax=Ooceraea biroi TaxID=2015173 RepID=UPI000F094E73|nr:uncharacterized protein LOC105283053 isoform X2 [Ooceraea biroi]